MYFFLNDYGTGAHPAVLKALCDHNTDVQLGYGEDAFSLQAARLLLAECDLTVGDVRFLTGGTQANATVLDALTASYQGVLCCDTAHIAVHEAGAVEAFGHKVITLPNRQGKLDAADLEAWLFHCWSDPDREHGVLPGAVYISQPTELGTLYSKAELEALAALCQTYALALYCDGARLGYGIAAPGNNVFLPDLARLCTAFTVGGTKVGALCGEAVVFPKTQPERFTAIMKRHGALLAKNRLVALQYIALFTDGLYYKLGRQGVKTGLSLREGLLRAGLREYVHSNTNQQFFVLAEEDFDVLYTRANFSVFGRTDRGERIARFVTAWDTDPALVADFVRGL